MLLFLRKKGNTKHYEREPGLHFRANYVSLPSMPRTLSPQEQAACTAVIQDVVWRDETAMIFFNFDFTCKDRLSFSVAYVPKNVEEQPSLSLISRGLCRLPYVNCPSDLPEWVTTCRETPCILRNVQYDGKKHFILRLQYSGATETGTAVNHTLQQPIAHGHFKHQEQCSAACLQRNLLWGDCVMWEYVLDPGTVSTHGCDCLSDSRSNYEKILDQFHGLCACCSDWPTYEQSMDSCVPASSTLPGSNCFLFSSDNTSTENGATTTVKHPKGTISRIFEAGKSSYRNGPKSLKSHQLSWQDVTISPWDLAQVEDDGRKMSSTTISFEYPLTVKELPTKGKIEWTTMPNIPVTGRQDMAACELYGNTVIIGGFQGGFCGGSSRINVNGKYWHEQTSSRLSHWLDAWVKRSGKETGQTPFKPRGFRNDTWMLENNNNGKKNGRRAEWKQLPEFPGRPRQLSSSTSLENVCYVYGGYSYTPMKLGDKTAAGKPKKDAAALRDGWALQRNDQGAWGWSRLPDLPGTVAGGGLAGTNRKLYFVGGVDYDAAPTGAKGSSQSFYFWTDRNQENPLTNNVLRSLDLDRLDLGWVNVKQFPGTPRMVIDNLVYSPIHNSLIIMGGVGGIPSHTYMSFFTEKMLSGKPVEEKLVYGLSSVVDNWSFDLNTMEWKRLHDLPIGANSLFRMEVLGDGRYAILAGGAHKYGYVVGRDMTLEQIYKGKITGTNFAEGGNWKASAPDHGLMGLEYGVAAAIYNAIKTDGGTLTLSKGEDGSDWCETVPGMNRCDCGVSCPKEMRCAGVIVYDILKDNYYRTNPLPLNVNQPTMTTVGNTITVLGGEANPTFLKNGRFVGIHSSLVIRGDWVLENDGNDVGQKLRPKDAWKQSCGKCNKDTTLCIEDLASAEGVRCVPSI